MNKNPIKVDSIPQQLTEYIIPLQHAQTMIYVTLKVKLLDTGWLFASAHTIFLELDNRYPKKTPEPEDLKLARAADLEGQRLNIRSHISRFRDGSDDDKPSRVEYKLIIEAGDQLLDQFVETSGDKNPTDFNTFIKFILQ
ncbi:MAG TPA: hypothetical protein VFW11_23225 [Cyclobacteriaceae bacterium]|nr:hypothetical protein [Cyclobacteriaceae bacterium]